MDPLGPRPPPLRLGTPPLTPALAPPAPEDAGAPPRARHRRPESAQVVDAKDAAYLHGYFHRFAWPLTVTVCRALPGPVGGGSVPLRDPHRLRPPPPRPGTRGAGTSWAGAAGLGKGRGFPAA
ncbi:unnamed protein product [Pipistrellus nathusii]|uniref:Uncharacterized protein n=1 Tax=Pipistrellus nathusii TaxID=59473 RepID=A0ABN9ZU65_PIPNA